MFPTNLLLGPLVGGLSHERALVWGRAQGIEDGAHSLHAWLGEQASLGDARPAGESLSLRAQDGFAGVAPLRDLQADHRYHYWLTIDDQPPAPGQGPLDGGHYPSFKTFPLPGSRASFNFAFGSCFRPEREDSGDTFRAIEARREEDDLRFLLMIGDQIYADDYKTNHLGKVAETLDEYRRVYAYNWSRPALRRLFYNLPAFMTLDDHEVDDDWRWRDAARQSPYIPWWDGLFRLLAGRPASERTITVERVRDALQAYWEHQGMHSPPFLLPLQHTPQGQYALPASDPGSLAYTFEYGPAAFFVMDTRTMRVRAPGGRTMLGEDQWHRLQSWLRAVKDAFPVKFIVSSCSLLFNMWTDIPKDRWSGYPKERDRLLSYLAAESIEGVYILSGDLHAAFAIRGELYGPEGRSLPVWEFCSSPFEQKPTWQAKYTRLPLFNGLFKKQECKFVVTACNYGLVRVQVGGGGAPEVRFELYGQDGALLGEAK